MRRRALARSSAASPLSLKVRLHSCGRVAQHKLLERFAAGVDSEKDASLRLAHASQLTSLASIPLGSLTPPGQLWNTSKMRLALAC